MSTSESPGRLACGRPVDDVLDQAAAGRADRRDDHQRSCLHCQAALAEYERLWSPLLELAAETVTAPDSVLETALSQIRTALADVDYGVLESPHGLTRISARVVVVAARESAQNVPGVRVALGKHSGVRLHRHGGGDTPPRGRSAGTEVTAGVAGKSTAIEIVLAADYGQDLPRLAERVRDEVTAHVRALTDLEPTEVTVVIDDVLN